LAARRVSSGSFRIPLDKLGTWTPLLIRVYQFESVRIAVPGSSRTRLSSVLWTLDELRGWAGITSGTTDDSELVALLDKLVEERQALRIDFGQESPPKFITRVGETVRLLGHTYEYWWRGRSGVDAVRWLVEGKKIPSQTVTAADFKTRLKAGIASKVRATYPQLVVETAIDQSVDAVATQLARGRSLTSVRFSEFQLRSSIEILSAQFDSNYTYKAQILTAGVGSGKTYAFLIPVLVSALVAHRTPPGRPHRQLLVYPRRALARDQFEKLQGVLRLLPDLHAHFDDRSQYAGSVLRGIEQSYGATSQLDVVILTLETLKRRLQHPLFVQAMTGGLDRVVLDEVHLAEGILGAQIALLMGRLRQAFNRPGHRVNWTAASATLAVPQLHAASIFGIQQPREVCVIQPDPDDLALDGIAHHVFIRPSGPVSTLGLLVNATSILLHTRRDEIGSRPGGPNADKTRPKAIGFADSLDMLGRWNADLRENERTEAPLRGRQHPGTATPQSWNLRQRELPYALRYRRPLERRLAASGGAPLTAFDAALGPLTFGGEARTGICSRCLTGHRELLGIAERPVLRELQKLVYREPHKNADQFKTLRVKSQVFESATMEVGSLDRCPYLEAGACQWFPQETPASRDPVEQIPGTTRPPLFEWMDVARSTVYSSKSGSDARTDPADGLAEIAFQDNTDRVYDVHYGRTRVPIDIVLASPSLEVGVDLPMLTESIMTKAIRNVASYRQKAGRIGRESGVDAVNVTLVTDNPIDLHYYRQPGKLVSLGRLDPIPLKDRNEAVVRSGVYSAVWDWLAVKGLVPEAIPHADAPNVVVTSFYRQLGLCKSAIERERPRLKDYLGGISPAVAPANSQAVEEAIGQALAELDLLLADAGGTLMIPGVTTTFHLADALALFLSHRDVRVRVDSASLRTLQRAVDDYKSAREDVPVERQDIALLLRESDSMEKSGVWTTPRILHVTQALDSWVGAHPTDTVNPTLGRIARFALDRIGESAGRIEAAHGDLRVLRAFQQFQDMLEDTQDAARAYYLSYLLQSLPVFGHLRIHRWYVRPETLYSNPYEGSVDIVDSAGEAIDSVPVTESLFGFIPGTWTHRLGSGCYKVSSGPMRDLPGGRLIIDLDRLCATTPTEMVRLSRPVPNPFGREGRLVIYQPETISVDRIPTKYVRLNLLSNMIRDGDESATGGNHGEDEPIGTVPIKIPRSFLDQWNDVEADAGRPLGLLQLNEGDEGRLAVDGPAGREGGPTVAEQVHHPLASALFEQILHHEKLQVTEYVLSSSRSYTTQGGRGVEVSFRNGLDEDAAIGTQYESEGISLRLRRDVLARTSQAIGLEIAEGSPAWTGSLIRMFKAHILEASRAGGDPLGTFSVNDVVSLVLQSLWPIDNPPSLSGLVRALRELANDNARLEQLAETHVRRRQDLLAVDEEATLGADVRQDDESARSDARRLVDDVRRAAPVVSDEVQVAIRWVRRSLLTSLGVACVTALQKFSGSKEDDVAYSIAPQSWNGTDDCVIYLFDRATFGNGSSEVAKRYLHIPHILRHGLTEWSRLLPSEDFLSALEEELLQCQQFQTDLSALRMLSSTHPHGVVGLRDIEAQSVEVKGVSGEEWRALGVNGPADAWRLSVVREIVAFVAADRGRERDNLIRATTICWSGCPECILRPEVTMGGFAGQNYLDKSILDRWFRDSREGVGEYATLELNDLQSAGILGRLGVRHRLVLERPNRLFRSISLPWTLGFELDRHEADPRLRLVLRTSDIRNLELGSVAPVSMGINSLGHKRLVWFSLLTSAYLDVLNLLPAEEKRIDLTYYDATDLSFDDIGLSPRMLAAVAAVSTTDGGPLFLERLSDILKWLLKRGFRIRICMDLGQANLRRPSGLLESLSRAGVPGLELVTKDMGPGLFHQKVLLTPVGAITGSANLTAAGSGSNEELVSWVPKGSGALDDVRGSVEDSFHGSSPWRPSP
jgi:DEAD/DEAH box helicase